MTENTFWVSFWALIVTAIVLVGALIAVPPYLLDKQNVAKGYIYTPTLHNVTETTSHTTYKWELPKGTNNVKEK
jgi:hypothetical protein